MTLKVLGSDRKHYEFPFTETTTVADIVAEIRKLLPPDVVQVDLTRDMKRLPAEATITSLGLAPTDELKFFCKRRSTGALGRAQSYAGRTHSESAPAPRYALPQRTDIDLSELQDPPDFDLRVATLMDLHLEGITEQDCQMALRTALFNTNKASEFLLAQSGALPPLSKVDRAPQHEITPEQREALLRLESANPGVDRATIIQVFIMCNKDEANAEAVISTMV
jgi:hypothetical protein